ncbi:hypothetical protein [Pseudonocardia sp.]|uniref:hypothetical protein n=1 Tax=Pseudonocardia sp. TaxID=60912 RepID=UPI003D122370
MPRRVPREHSDRPLQGFKLAYPMLSADGTRAGFSGVTVGRGHVYLAVDEAVCVQGSRHAPPSRWCDCGFYCFHEASSALDLACDPDHAGAVLLKVAVSGRYRRHERGLRYSRQRVRAVRIGRCACGRAAGLLSDTGTGTVGWRRLLPVCPSCTGTRPVLEPGEFARLGGGRFGVSTEPPDPTPPAVPPDDAGAVAVLTAELAVLHARLDAMQASIDALRRHDER